jgi:GNAT superfamily N-acetyltransferase
MSEIRRIEDRQEVEAMLPLLQELRPELTPAAFLHGYDEARRADGYALAGVFEAGACVALIGYRVLHDFVHGRHLYVDDLVTTARRRGAGLGARLLRFAESEAERLGCASLRLCTGNGNDAGKRFYEREGWTWRAVVFKKPLGRSAR